MTFRDPASGEMVNELQRVRYTHEAMIDLMLAQPGITQNELASYFGYTPSWVSIMINSDAFQGAYAARKDEVITPALMASIESRFKAVAQLSLDRLVEKLGPGMPVTDDFAIKSAQLAASAMGYGGKKDSSVNLGVVINLPGQAPSTQDWAAKYSHQTANVTSLPTAQRVDTVVDHEVPVQRR